MSKLYGGILVFGLDQCTSRAIKYMQLDLAILYNMCAFKELKTMDNWDTAWQNIVLSVLVYLHVMTMVLDI